MAAITIPADGSTLTLNGTVLTDFVEGDVIIMTPVNPASSHVNSTNGGTNINERSDKGVFDMTINAQKFSGTDVFLNNVKNQSPIVILNGSLKTNYNRDGVDFQETWTIENASISTQPTQTINTTDGNALMSYVIRIRNAVRKL